VNKHIDLRLPVAASEACHAVRFLAGT